MGDWLREIRKKLPGDSHFFAEMDRQLGESFRRATSRSASSMMLAPPLPPEFERFEMERYEGGGRVRCELLDVDTVHPVTFAWRRYEAGLRFWWEELPTELLEATARERQSLREHLHPPFAVRVGQPVWPHVSVVLSSDEDLIARDLTGHVHEIVERWNDTHGRRRGVIHNFAAARRLAEGRYAFAVDFGSASVQALDHMLAELGARLPIDEATLDMRR